MIRVQNIMGTQYCILSDTMAHNLWYILTYKYIRYNKQQAKATPSVNRCRFALYNIVIEASPPHTHSIA
jgi:hypothetical protein